MPKQSDTDDKGFYVGPRVNLLHAQSDGEPVGILHNTEAGFKEVVTRDTTAIYDNNPQPRFVEEIFDFDRTRCRQEREMSTRDELNQANNRNGDLLTVISKLQKRVVELEAKPDASARPTHRDMAYFGASEAAGYHYPGEDQQLLRDAYCRGAAEYALRSDVSAGLIEAAKELADLMDDVVRGNYKPDSFTTQPLRKALHARAADRSAK